MTTFRLDLVCEEALLWAALPVDRGTLRVLMDCLWNRACALREEGLLEGVPCAVTLALMTDGAGELGLDSEQLPATAQAVASALAAGKVVICSVVPGDFTTVGHFIVLAGLTDDGQVEVHDPNSAERSRAWDLDRVLGQCANLWALSA